ncbi:hypothetical protein Poli38472_005786 [Pythium oligandrum]|uniref:CR-type domain-containing protein n=1 Tax=Pythium oligandrum TaxID=41045 RepID=A0A8K1CU48_PYTOL|nr:hypothetical protein Poli38472_005786 [Pythium oligandrum]|eukprot:TMW68318.1 hypothetical protein Poli38472_005786 [Pythium oligandrum]
MRYYGLDAGLPAKAALRIRQAPHGDADVCGRISKGHVIAVCAPEFQVPSEDDETLLQKWLHVVCPDDSLEEMVEGYVMASLPDGMTLMAPWEDTDFLSCCRVLNEHALLYDSPLNNAEVVGRIDAGEGVRFPFGVLAVDGSRVQIYHDEYGTVWVDAVEIEVICEMLEHPKCKARHSFFTLNEQLPSEAQIAIRSFPSKEAETVTLLSRGDVIEAELRSEKWLQLAEPAGCWIMLQSGSWDLLTEIPYHKTDRCEATQSISNNPLNDAPMGDNQVRVDSKDTFDIQQELDMNQQCSSPIPNDRSSTEDEQFEDTVDDMPIADDPAEASSNYAVNTEASNYTHAGSLTSGHWEADATKENTSPESETAFQPITQSDGSPAYWNAAMAGNAEGTADTDPSYDSSMLEEDSDAQATDEEMCVVEETGEISLSLHARPIDASFDDDVSELQPGEVMENISTIESGMDDSEVETGDEGMYVVEETGEIIFAQQMETSYEEESSICVVEETGELSVIKKTPVAHDVVEEEGENSEGEVVEPTVAEFMTQKLHELEPDRVGYGLFRAIASDADADTILENLVMEHSEDASWLKYEPPALRNQELHQPENNLLDVLYSRENGEPPRTPTKNTPSSPGASGVLTTPPSHKDRLNDICSRTPIREGNAGAFNLIMSNAAPEKILGMEFGSHRDELGLFGGYQYPVLSSSNYQGSFKQPAASTFIGGRVRGNSGSGFAEASFASPDAKLKTNPLKRCARVVSFRIIQGMTGTDKGIDAYDSDTAPSAVHALKERAPRQRRQKRTDHPVEMTAVTDQGQAEEEEDDEPMDCLSVVMIAIVIGLFVGFFGFLYVQMTTQSDIISRRLQNAPKAEPKHLSLQVTLAQLYNGRVATVDVDRQLVCRHCAGSGMDLKAGFHTCHACQGSGVRTVTQQIGPFQQQMRTTCSVCKGRGKIANQMCDVCHGHGSLRDRKTLSVTIERGMKHGDTIVVPKEGDQSVHVLPGDVVVHLTMSPHKLFTRRGDDLETELKISLLDALVGFTTELTHLDGRTVRLSRTAVVAPTDVWRIPDEGMPVRTTNVSSKRSTNAFGDLLIRFAIQFPNKLSHDEKHGTILLLFPTECRSRH